jgi:stage V sporulation protein K
MDKNDLLAEGSINYKKIYEYCSKLASDGLYDQVENVTHEDWHLTLDRYVQSVLISLADSVSSILSSEQEYIENITETDPLNISETGITEEIYKYAEKVASLPPVMLELAGLHDNMYGGSMTLYFLDSLLNILSSMAMLSDSFDHDLNERIRKYAESIESFVFIDDSGSRLMDMLLEKKLSEKDLSDHVKELIRFKEDKNDRTGKTVVSGSRTAGASDKEKADPVSSDNISGKKNGDKEQKDLLKKKEIKTEDQEKDKDPDIHNRENDAEGYEGSHQNEEDKFLSEEELAKKEFLKVKLRIQEREKAERADLDRRVNKASKELFEMVGLDEVKEEIKSLVNLIKIRNMRKRYDLPLMDMTYHMVFTGGPGTGKTTVARIVGNIFKELGILSKGTMIETDRSRLVAGYVGQTAINVRETVEKALGGVLFIDEAYALVNHDVQNDFGGEAIDTLVKMMEDHRDDLVVIAAGYTDEMKEFLNSNTGLKSRFNKFIEFEDYDSSELLKILDVMAMKAGMKFDEAAHRDMELKFTGMTANDIREFGNARGVRNLFEKAVMNQANRLVTLSGPDKDELSTITLKDTMNIHI